MLRFKDLVKIDNLTYQIRDIEADIVEIKDKIEEMREDSLYSSPLKPILESKIVDEDAIHTKSANGKITNTLLDFVIKIEPYEENIKRLEGLKESKLSRQKKFIEKIENTPDLIIRESLILLHLKNFTNFTQVATELHMSDTSIIRKLRKTFGNGYIDYIKSRRKQ